MSKIETYMVDEDINIPSTEQKFYKFEKVEDLEIKSFHGGDGVPYGFRFKTEFGDVFGYTNPAWASQNGYFQVSIGNGSDAEYGYCTNPRIVATFRKVCEEAFNGNGKTAVGSFDIVDDKEAEEIYQKYESPQFTLI